MTDIHGFFQQKRDDHDGWETVLTHLSIRRDYILFAALAGLRLHYMPEAIKRAMGNRPLAPRGLPPEHQAIYDGITHERMDAGQIDHDTLEEVFISGWPDGHSFTWLDFNDLRKAKICYVLGLDARPYATGPDADPRDHIRAADYDDTDEPINVDFEAIYAMAKAYHAFGRQVRLVCWWDN